MSLHTALIAALLLTLAVGSGRFQDFHDKWITRPPIEYEFPHVVFITIPDSEEICSGTLIHESWVLTVASCMYQDMRSLINNVETSLVVYAGVKDRTQLNGTNVQKRSSVRVRFPDEKNDFTYYSPALIKVNQPFKLSPTLGVNKIDMSTSSYLRYDHQICKAGSYGAFYWKDEIRETNLKKLDLRTYECNCTKEMQIAFPESSIDKWICGKTKGVVGICRGDFGMGMICDGVMQAVSVGLMRLKDVGSCEIEDKNSTVCSLTKNVGLFVDVCFYLEWMRQYVSSIEPPQKPCKGHAWRPRANLPVAWAVLVQYSLFVLAQRFKYI